MIRLIIGIGLTFWSSYSFSCDICGCASSSFSMGMLPNSKYHLIGLRYGLRSFESQDLHALDHRIQSREIFTTTELFGRYQLSKKIQLLAVLPYVHNTKIDDLKSIYMNGVGDVTFMGNYVFVDQTDSLKKKLKQSGTVGIGVKLPTGKSFQLGFNEINMLPGTGSLDYLFNINYAIQVKTIGFQNETSLTIKTANKSNYRFGNALNSSQLLFYRWVVNEKLKIVPQIGVNYTWNGTDVKNGKQSEDTFNGGYVLNAQGNLFILMRNWIFSTQIYIPAYQHVNQGYVNQKGAVRLSINYNIKTNEKK